jgi:phytoene dehydrogenase-like protein
MVTTETYDGILLGAGHNALILQAYLGRAGLKTVCLERRAVAGGGLSTVEDPRRPGFLHNTHSFYHRALTQMPWYRDLGLEERGGRYIEPDLNVALILRTGEALEWWTNFERTVESFAAFSRKDAAALRRWRDEFLPIVEHILTPEAQSPPVATEERTAMLERTAEGRRLLEVSKLSPLDFVESEFEHPVIRAGLLFFNGLREVDLRVRGFGHHIPALLASRHKAQMCIGGSASLAKALVSAVTDSGGEVRLNVNPRRIHVENGRAAGVETSDQHFIRARHFLVSGLNPIQTFVDLLDTGLVPAAWREQAANFRFNLLAPLFALNVNLKETPRYLAAEKHPELDRGFMMILGLEDSAQFQEIVSKHESGEIPATVMWGSCPTLFDPSQAPAGFHTAFMWEKLPYRLRGDPANWDGEADLHARRMLDVWTGYAPNLRDALLDYSAQSPLDTERTLPNMRYGDLLVGALSHGQSGYNRPFPGAGTYRSCFPNLYLCGGSSYPGGNITGLPGYNCAKVLLDDLGLERRAFTVSAQSS